MVETSALRRSDEIKTAVLRSVSHDLRSPLTAIVAAGEALSSPALEPDDRLELADTIALESRRLARLVDQLLDLARLEGGSAEPREDWCSLEEVIRAAAEDAAAGDRVRLSIAAELPLVRADAGQLRRAFANLIENALRYGDHEPVSVRARVSGGRILMRVVDQGPGIPLAEQERIFAPFYRGTDAAGQGSGLGLAIVRGLVEANGGHVHVESLPGQGTSFVVELPLPRRRGGARVTRVLVVDDEPQILRALRVVLREAGYEAIPAETAEEALDRAAIRPPDAAIVDLVLPDGDGVEVTRRLREWSQMPIIVLSAVGDEAEKVRALEAGADDYVTKPFGPRELVARLQAALRRASGPPTSRRSAPTGSRSTSPPGSCGSRAPRSISRRSSSTCCARWPATAGRCSRTGRCWSRCGVPSTRATPRCCARTSPTCGARSAARTSAPIPASATASPTEAPSSRHLDAAARTPERGLDGSAPSVAP